MSVSRSCLIYAIPILHFKFIDFMVLSYAFSEEEEEKEGEREEDEEHSKNVESTFRDITHILRTQQINQFCILVTFFTLILLKVKST